MVEGKARWSCKSFALSAACLVTLSEHVCEKETVSTWPNRILENPAVNIQCETGPCRKRPCCGRSGGDDFHRPSQGRSRCGRADSLSNPVKAKYLTLLSPASRKDSNLVNDAAVSFRRCCRLVMVRKATTGAYSSWQSSELQHRSSLSAARCHFYGNAYPFRSSDFLNLR